MEMIRKVASYVSYPLFQEDYVPGLLYFVVAGLAAISILCLFCLPETMNETLADKIMEDVGNETFQEKL